MQEREAPSTFRRFRHSRTPAGVADVEPHRRLCSLSTLVSSERVEWPLNRLVAELAVPGQAPRRASPLLGYHAGVAGRSWIRLNAVSSVPVVTCCFSISIAAGPSYAARRPPAVYPLSAATAPARLAFGRDARGVCRCLRCLFYPPVSLRPPLCALARLAFGRDVRCVQMLPASGAACISRRRSVVSHVR